MKRMSKNTTLLVVGIVIAVVLVIALAVGIFFSTRARQNQPSVVNPDPQDDPVDPAVDDKVVAGKYSCTFWGESAVCTLLDNYAFVVDDGADRLFAGEYVIRPNSQMTLIVNGQNVQVRYDLEEHVLTPVDVTQGMAAIDTYTYNAAGTHYRLHLFQNNLIKIESAGDEGRYSVVGYGMYTYDQEGRFVAKYYGKEWILVLFELNHTFAPWAEQPVHAWDGEYRFAQHENNEEIVYLLWLEDARYRLERQSYVDGTLITSSTSMGSFKESGDLLSLEDGRLFRINKDAFRWVIRTVNTVNTSSGDRSFRLTLEENSEYGFDYEVVELGTSDDDGYYAQGSLTKDQRQVGVALWPAQDGDEWIYLDAEDLLTPLSILEGDYRNTTEEGDLLELHLDCNGSYNLATNRVQKTGTYTIVGGKVTFDNQQIRLSARGFWFVDTTTVLGCNLPTSFVVGEAIDLTTAQLWVRDAFGKDYSIALTADMITDYYTDTAGERVAVITVQGLTYRHIYEVFLSERAQSFELHNFPAVLLRGSTPSLEQLFAVVTTNLGNSYTVDHDIVVTGLDTSMVGYAVCSVKCEGVMQSVRYEVVTERVVTGIRLFGARNSFDQGEELDVGGAYIVVSYNYGNQDSIDVSQEMVKMFETDVVGEHVALVVYMEQEVQWSYSVRRVFEMIELPLGISTGVYTGDSLDYDHLGSLSFASTEDGIYRFFSQCDWDVRAYLFDAEGELIASDDDSGEGMNFALEVELRAGETYRLAVWVASTYREVLVTVEKQ